jgi:uncharacterized protein with GYD domain
MPHYLFQGRYTAAAINAMIDDPQDREAAARKLIESAGATMHSFFFCFGAEDAMALIEAPDDTTMTALAMAIGASGAFSGGSTTKLMTSGQAQDAMRAAGAARDNYAAPTG